MGFLAFLGVLFFVGAVAAGLNWYYAWRQGNQRWDTPKPTPLLRRRHNRH